MATIYRQLWRAGKRLLDVGFGAPPWADLQRGAQLKQNELEDAEPGAKEHGWQRGAAQKLEDCFVSGALWSRLAPSLRRHSFRSQRGLPFSCVLTARHSRFDAHLCRVLLLRRLQLTGLPLDPRGLGEGGRGGSWDEGVLLWKVRPHCRRKGVFERQVPRHEAMTYFGHDLLWPRPTFVTAI